MTRTIDEYRELLEVPSSADHDGVFFELQRLNLPVVWERYSSSDINFIARIRIGEHGSSKLGVIIFSLFGNLCCILFNDSADAWIHPEMASSICERYGWSVVDRADLEVALWSPPDETVFLSFFAEL
jgi:hypothetical protein